MLNKKEEKGINIQERLGFSNMENKYCLKIKIVLYIQKFYHLSVHEKYIKIKLSRNIDYSNT